MNYTHSQTVERMRAVSAEMETLGDKTRVSAADDDHFNQLNDEFDDLDRHRLRLERAAQLAGAGQGRGRFRVERGSIGEDGNGRGDDRRSDALRCLDAAVRDDRLAARGAELAERAKGVGPVAAQSWLQRWTVAAGSPEYEAAFARLVADPERGHLLWSPEEAEAFRTVEALRMEQRAMSTTDSAGGFSIPLTLDPAITLTSNGSTNPLRQISRVVTTTTDAWAGLTSAGVTAEWIAEAAEVADASPTLGQPSIPLHKLDAFVPFSFEIQSDGLNFLPELSKLLADGADQLTATAFTTGSGSGQPKGIITALAAASGTVPLITPGVAETLTATDVFAVQNALPPRFQPNAVWNANLSLVNTLRALETTNGALRFPGLQDNPPMLLGRTMYENSNMDGAWDAAATANNYVLVYGSWENFVIVDKIGGATLELVPHLFGSNRRPTGQRGALLWARVGSDCVAPQAFRMLSIPTTA